MKQVTVSEAQARLPELLQQTHEGPIALTDEDGNLLGMLSAIDDDNIDDLLVQTPGFKAMIAESLASMETHPLVPVEDLLAEAHARMAQERDAEEGSRQP